MNILLYLFILYKNYLLWSASICSSYMYMFNLLPTDEAKLSLFDFNMLMTCYDIFFGKDTSLMDTQSILQIKASCNL